MRILILAGTIAAATAGAASAQSLSPFREATKPPLTQEEAEKLKKLDSDYRAAVDNLPERKSADPWGNIRPAPSKPAKTKQP